jgi:BASS family bile acid:Na+ symporter
LTLEFVSVYIGCEAGNEIEGSFATACRDVPDRRPYPRGSPLRNCSSMLSRTRITAFLASTSFGFPLAVVVGLAYGGGASSIEPAMVPLLAAMMTISILDISSGIFADFRRSLRPVVAALVLNYIVQTGLLLALSYLIISDADVHAGFVLLAAVPPAAGTIPLTYVLGGNTKLSLLAVVALLMVALAAGPLICIIFLGAGVINPLKLLTVLGEVIVVPIIASRLLRRTRIADVMLRWRDVLVSWGVSLLIYTIVGLNRDAFFEDIGTVLIVAAIIFVSTFVLGEVIRRVAASLGVKKADAATFIMLGTRKDPGLAGAIALVFFGPVAALASAVYAAVTAIHFVFLAWIVKRIK